jgi:hypothetical protein
MILMNFETDGLVLELHDHLHVVRSNLLVYFLIFGRLFLVGLLYMSGVLAARLSAHTRSHTHITSNGHCK